MHYYNNLITYLRKCIITDIYGKIWDDTLHDIAQNQVEQIHNVAEYQPRSWQNSYSG